VVKDERSTSKTCESVDATSLLGVNFRAAATAGGGHGRGPTGGVTSNAAGSIAKPASSKMFWTKQPSDGELELVTATVVKLSVGERLSVADGGVTLELLHGSDCMSISSGNI